LLSKYIGPRIIKTGIAVVLSIYAINIFNIGNPFFAAIAAIISIQPSVVKGVIKGYERLIGTLIGAVIATTLLYTLPPSPLSTGLTVIVTIAILVKLNLPDAVLIATVMVLVIMADVKEEAVIYTIQRIFATAIGVAIGTLVNLFIYAPLHNKAFLVKFHNMLKLLSTAFLDINSLNNSCHENLNINLESLKGELENLKNEATFKIAGNYEGVSEDLIKKYQNLVYLVTHIITRVEEITEALAFNQDSLYSNEAISNFLTNYFNTCSKISNLLDFMTVEQGDMKESKLFLELEESKGTLRKQLMTSIKSDEIPFETLLQLSHLLFLMEEIKNYISQLYSQLISR
jgi:uncharacterized membrane protein YgaE (UPF0421/DUF939 family)